MKKIIFSISAFLAINAISGANAMSLKLVPRMPKRSIAYRIPGNTMGAKLEYLRGRAFNPKVPAESEKDIKQMVRDILAESGEKITPEDFKKIVNILYFNEQKRKIDLEKPYNLALLRNKINCNQTMSSMGRQSAELNIKTVEDKYKRNEREFLSRLPKSTATHPLAHE